MRLTKAVIAFLTVAAVPAGLPAQETLEIPPEIMEAIQTDVATIHLKKHHHQRALYDRDSGISY